MSLPCTFFIYFVELSSIIQEVKAVRLSNTRAIIFWKQKSKPKIQYDVICKKCKDLKCDQNCPETVRLERNKTNISGKNSSDITGLERGHDYWFIVVGKIEAVNENYWNETSKKVRLRGTKVPFDQHLSHLQLLMLAD